MSRLLLVEDEPVNIQAVSAILKDQGHQISVATNGLKALEVLTRIRPDLILLDVMMPGFDGFQTCQRIKASEEWRDVPIIFLTGKTGAADIVRGFEVGAVDYIAKPFSAPELIARVRTHLALDQLHRENRRLLLNILPAPVADRLKQSSGIVADRYDDVSVMFADIVGFTAMSSRLSPAELLDFLNTLWSRFDDEAGRLGLEKIKTVGDEYMVAGGLPEPHPDHLGAMAILALSLRDIARQFGGLSMRVGLHVGSVIAGVIGTRKLSYDIWGATVNLASRLESRGEPGRIHVSEEVFRRLEGRFLFEPRGALELKGCGPTQTYWLVGAVSSEE